MPAWHLDFRNTSRLPDVKPIRTSFFVNGVSVVLALVVIINFANQELALYGLRSQVSDLEEEISKDKVPSAAAVQNFQQFKTLEKKIEEVNTFLLRQIAPSAFYLRIGSILPDHIVIESIDWRADIVSLRGSVSGTPDEASGYASSFVAALGSDEILGPICSEVSLTSLARNPATDRLAMEIRMTLKPVEK